MNMVVRITSYYIVPFKREYDPVAIIGFIFQPSLVFIFCEHFWIYKDSLSFLKNFLGSYSTNLRADAGAILCKGFLLIWSATAEYLKFPFWECFRCSWKRMLISRCFTDAFLVTIGAWDRVDTTVYFLRFIIMWWEKGG